MALRYKIDVLAALKAAGYTSYRIAKEKVFSTTTIQNFRDGKVVSASNLEQLCQILDMQPGDIIEYIADK